MQTELPVAELMNSVAQTSTQHPTLQQFIVSVCLYCSQVPYKYEATLKIKGPTQRH
jgi:hypothetical protein